MENETRRFNIAIKNHVQFIGFRGLVESMAKDFGLKGYVYNDKNGSVKIVCEGPKTAVENFISDIQKISPGAGIEKEEITDIAFLPDEFGRIVIADELSMILNRGIELLSSIKEDTSLLSSIKEDTSLLSSIKEDTSLLSSIKETLGDIKDVLQKTAKNRRSF